MLSISIWHMIVYNFLIVHRHSNLKDVCQPPINHKQKRFKLQQSNWSTCCCRSKRFEHARVLRMRTTWHFWSCFSGVFEQEGGHVGQAVGENRASSAVFFFPTTKIHQDPNCVTSIWGIKARGQKTVDSLRHSTDGSERTGDKRLNDSGVNWSKFGRSRSFFPTTSSFELSESFVDLCKRLAPTWERAWTDRRKLCFPIRYYI